MIIQITDNNNHSQQRIQAPPPTGALVRDDLCDNLHAVHFAAGHDHMLQRWMQEVLEFTNGA